VHDIAGFSVDRATVELDARVGGRQRFVMVDDLSVSVGTIRPVDK
jgi:hypothetical protein